MANINSFAENINKLVTSSNNQISILNGIQESVITDSNSVKVSVTDEDGKDHVVEIPSWTSLSKQVEAFRNSINTILQGKGIVSLGDGTNRTVKLSTIAYSPSKITGLQNPTSFNIDPNWWFEDLMYPSSYVSVDLLGKIDDSSDRVLVNRVILDYKNTEAVNLYYNSIYGSNISYENLIVLLTNNNVTYTQDEEILSLPLSKVNYIGKFNISDIEFKSGYQWYTVDTLEYKSVSTENSTFDNSTIKLKVGDKMSRGDMLYTVVDINEATSQIRLTCTIGYSFPSTGDTLIFYNEPWQTKEVNVKFSNNEINIVYFKGINEDFNIPSNEWSEPIMFVSNELSFAGDNTTDYNSYYFNNIVDWGRQMIDDVRERKISASRGVKPNAPVLNVGDFSVVQINTQVNASIDTAEILQMKADIETTKSRLTSKRAALASQQTNLQETTDQTEASKLKKQIQENTKEIEQLQTSYRTSLSTIQSILKENNGIDVKPKYHIRGFFQIPLPAYNGTQEQQVIGFQIAYRYIKEDSTGVDLKTYTYTDQNNDEHVGVYSDWTIYDTPILEKTFDPEANSFRWVQGNPSKGDEVNINQVDIPITKGEKVEFMIRSVSEAGYPYSPLKSDWSNKVIMDFPSNLMTASDIENLITDINDENTTITVESILDTNGIVNHLSDTIANTNTTSGVYFKHEAKNLAVDVKDENGAEKTISLQEGIDNISNKVNDLYSSISDGLLNLKTADGTTVGSVISTYVRDHYATVEENVANNFFEYKDSNGKTIVELVKDLVLKPEIKTIINNYVQNELEENKEEIASIVSDEITEEAEELVCYLKTLKRTFVPGGVYVYKIDDDHEIHMIFRNDETKKVYIETLTDANSNTVIEEGNYHYFIDNEIVRVENSLTEKNYLVLYKIEVVEDNNNGEDSYCSHCPYKRANGKIEIEKTSSGYILSRDNDRFEFIKEISEDNNKVLSC